MARAKQKTTKESEGKKPDLEQLSGDLQELSEQEAPHEIYMPQDESFMNGIKKSWSPYKPRNFYEQLWKTASPASYFLWKMPPETHKKFNDLLGYALVIFGKEPRTAAVLGVTDGVSQAVYGIKTMRDSSARKSESGKHVMSGLTKIVDHAEKSDDPKIKNFGSKVKRFFERYMVNFDPEKAAA